MRHPDTGAVVGVSCLCFHLEEEMASIFHPHRRLTPTVMRDAGCFAM